MLIPHTLPCGPSLKLQWHRLLFKYILFFPTVHVHVTDLQIQTVRQVNIPAFSDLSLITCIQSAGLKTMTQKGLSTLRFSSSLLFLTAHSDTFFFSKSIFTLLFSFVSGTNCIPSSILLQWSYKSISRSKVGWQNTALRDTLAPQPHKSLITNHLVCQY